MKLEKLLIAHEIMAGTEHCMFYVKRKKRYCRMTVKKGHQYCGEHQQSFSDVDPDDSNSDCVRVKCPLDPTHTCFKSKLAKHLRICNVKRLLESQPPYIVAGINVDDVSEAPQHVPLPELEQSIIEEVIRKVNTAYGKLPEFPEITLQHEVLRNKLNDKSCGRAVRKHLLQNASLLSHLENSGLVRDNTCYMEFGAGKGKLTYWLGQLIKERKDSCILLVDRASHRHKSDNKLRNEQSPHLIHRIRADIANLKLNNVSEIQAFEHKVGIAKHLCGAATDLTLKCLVREMECESEFNVTGLIIAFCCHHRCDYISYVGKTYLEDCNFSPNEFPILCSIASWATCGSGLSRTAQNESHEMLASEERSVTPDASERELIGRKVKTLLNWGRLEYLRTAGFKSDLVYYIPTDISLENMCIISTNTHLPQ